jgi:hypothetical protein
MPVEKGYVARQGMAEFGVFVLRAAPEPTEEAGKCKNSR